MQTFFVLFLESNIKRPSSVVYRKVLTATAGRTILWTLPPGTGDVNSALMPLVHWCDISLAEHEPRKGGPDVPTTPFRTATLRPTAPTWIRSGTAARPGRCSGGARQLLLQPRRPAQSPGTAYRLPAEADCLDQPYLDRDLGLHPG